MIQIYTDGSCLNGGNGGFGIVIIKDNILEKIISKRYDNTTNNRMELSAILLALGLSQTIYKNEKVTIKSDSAYCVNMFNIWIDGWANNNWLRQGKFTIENMDLVKSIYKYKNLEWSNFSIEKVKGHCGNIYNEIADGAATNNKAKINKILKDNNILFEEKNFIEFY